ncbi:MAG: DUF2971 domain-containing protein [Phycisphaerales bacterium]
MLYKYRSLADAVRDISKQQLRWSSPFKFNDPFDGQWDSLWQLRTPAFRKAAQELLLRHLLGTVDWARLGRSAYARYLGAIRLALSKLAPGAGEARARELLEAAEKAHRESSIRPLAAGVMDFIRRMRIFCLTPDPTSLLMWSHYGDAHRGVAIGFDTSTLEEQWKVPAKKVKYSDLLPEVASVTTLADRFEYDEPLADNYDQTADALTLTKAKSWEYEAEWRFVAVARRGVRALWDDFSYPLGAVSEIIAGCKCDERSVERVHDALRAVGASPRIRKLARHHDRFAVSFLE